MPDLLAGSTIRSVDTPPTVSDVQLDSFTFTITAFGVATTGGTYADCGVAFAAPTTGRVIIWFTASLHNNGSTSNAIDMAPAVRTGATVGSGAAIVAASFDNSVRMRGGTNEYRFGAHLFVSGLTAGDAYNVRLEHRVSAGTGTLQRRVVTVAPAT